MAALTGDQASMKTEIAGLGNGVAGESSSARIDRLKQISGQQNILSILNDRIGAQQQLVSALRTMGTTSRDPAKDRASPDIAVAGCDCRDLPVRSPGRLGPPIGLGKAGPRSPPKADIVNSSKSGNTTCRIVINPADHLRCAAADAHDPRSGDCRTHRRLSGFHPRILRLVCFDGPNGVRVRDWVEIDGVGGEVVHLGLFRTWLLETGNWTANGHPTGRKVSFLNGYAIRGKYFNFSTVGQWMWDEIKVTIPPGTDIHRSSQGHLRSDSEGHRSRRENGGRRMEASDPRRRVATV